MTLLLPAGWRNYLYFLCFILHSERCHDCYAKLSIRFAQKDAVRNRKLFLNNNANYLSATAAHHFNFIRHDENNFLSHFSIGCGAIHQHLRHTLANLFTAQINQSWSVVFDAFLGNFEVIKLNKFYFHMSFFYVETFSYLKDEKTP